MTKRDLLGIGIGGLLLACIFYGAYLLDKYGDRALPSSSSSGSTGTTTAPAPAPPQIPTPPPITRPTIQPTATFPNEPDGFRGIKWWKWGHILQCSKPGRVGAFLLAPTIFSRQPLRGALAPCRLQPAGDAASPLSPKPTRSALRPVSVTPGAPSKGTNTGSHGSRRGPGFEPPCRGPSWGAHGAGSSQRQAPG